MPETLITSGGEWLERHDSHFSTCQAALARIKFHVSIEVALLYQSRKKSLGSRRDPGSVLHRSLEIYWDI